MKVLLNGLLVVCGLSLWAGTRPVPSPALAERLNDRSLEVFGIVHWGPNTYTDREWGYGDENPKDLNPDAFDARQIAAAAKAGGLGGLVVVAKHHDGFCLWPTKTTEHNLSRSPFRGGKGDYVKEMSDACRAAGLKFGIYCSPWDRNHPDYGTAKYLKAYRAQLQELLGGAYGDVFEMWFDNANGGTGYYGGACEAREIPRDYYDYPALFKLVRKLQPKVTIFNEDDAADFRWPGNELGYVDPASRATVRSYDSAKYTSYCNLGDRDGTTFHPCEGDFPLRRGWFYHDLDKGTAKSGAYLMQRYLYTVGSGATMNIGLAPDRHGRLCDEDVAALADFRRIRDAFFAQEAKDGEPFNVVVLTEDLAAGEQVDEWELLADGQKVAGGGPVGVKRIKVLEKPVTAKTVEFKVVAAGEALKAVTVRRYLADPKLVAEVMSAQAPSGETETAKWMTAAAAARELRLDGVFGDNMVLQRDKPIRLSGSAAPVTRLTATLNGKIVETQSNAAGRWTLNLPAQPSGGPADILIRDKTGREVTLRNVLFGDVWVCSGQSNMEFHLWESGKKDYCLTNGQEIVAAAKDGRIRFLYVPKRYCAADDEQTDPPENAAWKVVGEDAEALAQISAVGYHFAKELRQALKGDIPVGIVSAAVGGTFIEAWIPTAAYESHPKELETELAFLHAASSLRPVDCVGGTDKLGYDAPNYQEELKAFAAAFENQDPAAKAAALADWAKMDLDEGDWKKGPPCELKGPLSAGIIWNRFHYELPESWVGEDLVFHFDSVKDADETFLDGVKIGSYGLNENPKGGAGVAREYPCRITKGGHHVIALRNFCYLPPCGLGAGIYFKNVKTGEQISYLGTDWLEKRECAADFAKCGRFPLPRSIYERSLGGSAVLYAGMIAPVTAMNVKGVIWYQGCANYARWRKYPLMQRLLVDGWRAAFRDAELPFVITQLAGFKEPWHEEKLGYAPIRETQRDMLEYPHVGVACAIDVGEEHNIHPQNKPEVARRLAREARRVAYGEKDVLAAPRIAGAKADGATLVVKVTDAGKGLYVKGGTIPDGLFAVAGEQGDYVPAKAELKGGDTILVTSEKVTKPARVRYAFGSWCGHPPIYRTGDDQPLFPYSSDLPK